MKIKRIIIVLSIIFMAFGCRTKKIIVTKKAKKDNKEVVFETKEIKESKEAEVSSLPIDEKVYANNTEKYIDIYKEIAQNEMKLYHIPASITLAQGILESGSGTGRLSVEANNHFGIKCHGWTGKKIYHDDDAKQECFRKYKDAKYSFRDHSLFLSERKRYSKLFDLKKEDYKGWARGLRAAGYATDKNYPQKLISLIERYELHKLDETVLGDAYTKYEVPEELNSIRYKVVKGDTLYSISKKYNVTVNELQKLNGLKDNTLSIGQELVVKP
jgi:flagellum-specific peptidoglycan hydrolase FlgJ